jgi:hypothetical protein
MQTGLSLLMAANGADKPRSQHHRGHPAGTARAHLLKCASLIFKSKRQQQVSPGAAGQGPFVVKRNNEAEIAVTFNTPLSCHRRRAGFCC